MAKPAPTPETQPNPKPAPPPAEGGSYTVDDQTGEHTLVARTNPNTEQRSKP